MNVSGTDTTSTAGLRGKGAAVRSAAVDLYGQEPEARLLTALLARVGNRTVVDVGAERGAFAHELLRAGSDFVHLIEPEPANADALRQQFAGDGRVTVHEYAAGAADGQLSLRRSFAPDGTPLSFGHTVLDRPDADEIGWHDAVVVEARSLASLVEEGAVPVRIGILKVDTEGHDLAVISGIGPLDPDVVMVEHWIDLPHSLGPCPWTIDEMTTPLAARGFSHFAFIVHRGEFSILQWDDAAIDVGAVGNLVFVHDRVLADVLPDVVSVASTVARATLETAEMFASSAAERLEVIGALEDEREQLTTAASERLSLIEELERECRLRLETIDDLRRQLDGEGFVSRLTRSLARSSDE
jgi:FkbM family methyltransferase